jgi:hypothetical protein
LDISTISRFLFSLASPVVMLLKKPWAERTAAHNPSAAAHSPIEDLDQETFVHLGVTSSTEAGWKRILEMFGHQLVKSEPFSLPHVCEWLNSSTTRYQLRQLAHARITSSMEPSDVLCALIDSYSLMSGEHHNRAKNIIDHAVNVLVAGVLGATKDRAMAGLIEVNMQALQQRFDEINMRFDAQSLPESDWSLDIAFKANTEWLLSAFSSRTKAKVRLGQPLCPADTTASIISMSRGELVARFESLLVESTAGGVVALTGDEGNGKSWLVAQAWLSLAEKPLTLFLTAEEIGEQAITPATLLAQKLCVQTDRQGSERHQEFWTTQLREWRKQHKGPDQGFLVVLDGLNQRPRTEWARVIDQLSEELECVGGKLILTSRRRYFDEIIKPRLVSSYRVLSVPEWSPSERDELLSSQNMRGGQLHERVASALRNPRLLSIALTLLDSEQLKKMEELSIPFLLFEHLRASQRDSYDQSAEHFKRNLQRHAKEVLQRLSTQQRDDLKVFDGGLDAVVEGRFFVPLTEDPTRYSVSEEGLGLALGLAILEELNKAHRNGHNLDEALAVIAEPIAALDQTSEAILASLTVACMSEENSTAIGAAILTGFAGLQNLDDGISDSINALARIRTPVFLEAMRSLALQGGAAINFDCVELALHSAKVDDQAWTAIASELNGWLTLVTLDVEKHVNPSGRSADDLTSRRLELKNELAEKLEKLSPSEKDIFDQLQRVEVQDVSVLGTVALRLMAGKPLADFAHAFMQWSFAKSLNVSHLSPTQEFRHLIRFNSIDWEATRAELLLFSQRLANGTPSNVGQWALVTLLQSTGHPDDALRAQKLVDDLSVDLPKGGGWRLVEDYCSTDPCDPNNAEPENVAKTATQYAAADVTSISLSKGMLPQDYFFNDARPAISRFYPEIAVNQHRSFFDDVLRRNALPLRQGVAGLLDHSALVTHQQALKFVGRLCGDEADVEALHSLGNEAQIWAQFQLQFVFPALEASEQLDSLLKARLGYRLQQHLVETIKPLDVQTFEMRLSAAVADQDEESQFIVLLFAPFVNRPLSPPALNHLPALLSSASTFVRAHALAMVAKSADSAALQMAKESGWNANQLSKDEALERWFGSDVLVAAAIQNVASWDKFIADMDVQHLGQLSARVGGEVSLHVALTIDALLQRPLELPVESDMLEIELMYQSRDTSRKPCFTLRERQLSSPDSEKSWLRALENEDSFNERQKKLHSSFEALLSHLTRIDAEKLLEQIGAEDFASIAAADTTLTERWCDLLLSQSNHANLVAFRNIGMQLARFVSTYDPIRAVQLFEKYDPIAPLVRVVFGRAAIELGATCIWSATESTELNALRMHRLDCATNNGVLACEVWAALWSGKSFQLTQYIEEGLASTLPAKQARAILVAGLMGENSYSERVLSLFAGVPGFLGETQRLAKALYERHIWAAHWLTLMRDASSSESFWRAAVLFLVVADGRIEALRLTEGKAQEIFHLHWPSIERRLQSRFDKLRKKWKEHFLSEKHPWPLFLVPPKSD